LANKIFFSAKLFEFQVSGSILGGGHGEGEGSDQGPLLRSAEEEEADSATQRTEVRLRLGCRRRHFSRLQPALQRKASDPGFALSSTAFKLLIK
jgi:hypothetical protein